MNSDQMASPEASLSGFTLFTKEDVEFCKSCVPMHIFIWEHHDSVVECLTQD